MAKQSESKTRPLPGPLYNPRLRDPKLYKPSNALWDAVEVSLLLEQPLLVTGDPGTGKTELASHIADYYELEFEKFDSKTTSTASDLFYKYDALAHFQRSHKDGKVVSVEEIEESFIQYQALGKAIQSKKRMVVLIDEIDKAPRDLPNDVLAAIDLMYFEVPELKNKRYEAQHRPIVIITSNSEKNLPDAFLRRVAYFHINPPEAEELVEILQNKIGYKAANEEKKEAEILGYSKEEIEPLVKHFDALCAEKTLLKNPATAELIHWVSLLHHFGFKPEVLKNSRLESNDRDILLKSYSVLAKTKDDLIKLDERLQKL